MTDFEKNSDTQEEINEDIITLTDEDTGEEVDFEIYDRVVIDDKMYFALLALDSEEEEYEYLRATVDGEDILFETIMDDDEFDKVADYFNDRLFGDVDYDEN